MKRILFFVVCILVIPAGFVMAELSDKNSKLFEAVKGYRLENVQNLINGGANPNSKDDIGRSVLMISLSPSITWELKGKSWRKTIPMDSSEGKEEGSFRVTESWLKASADVFFIKKTETKRGQMQVVKLLLEKGAEVNAIDKNGNTALMYAAGKGFTELVELLLEKDAEVNAIDKEGNTALMYAARKGFTEVVKLLLEKGAEVNAKDKYGNTALQKALMCYELEPLIGLRGVWRKKKIDEIEEDKEYQMQVVNLLLEKGAEINVKNEDGHTELISASRCGFTGLVKLLLEKGAEVNAKDKYGNTVLEIAEKKGHLDTVELLKKAGAK